MGFLVVLLLVGLLTFAAVSCGMTLANTPKDAGPMTYVGAFGGGLLAVIAFFYAFGNLAIIKEWDEGVVLTLGRYTGQAHKGLNFFWGGFQTVKRVDMRTRPMDIPEQDCITKDNISIKLDGVAFFKVIDARKSVLNVTDYEESTKYKALVALRNIVGETSLDDLLAKREQIAAHVSQIVDKETQDPWGVDVESIQFQKIILPDDMKEVMAQRAVAEREADYKRITSEGDVKAAENYAKAAEILESKKGAMQLRMLEALQSITTNGNNKVIIPFPIEMMAGFKGMEKFTEAVAKA
jgi:regulator of protease activity HflC (stomatin/prohibitin superfamily)